MILEQEVEAEDDGDDVVVEMWQIFAQLGCFFLLLVADLMPLLLLRCCYQMHDDLVLSVEVAETIALVVHSWLCYPMLHLYFMVIVTKTTRFFGFPKSGGGDV